MTTMATIIARFAARAHFGDSIGPIGDDNAICDRVNGTHQKVADRARNAERKISRKTCGTWNALRMLSVKMVSRRRR